MVSQQRKMVFMRLLMMFLMLLYLHYYCLQQKKKMAYAKLLNSFLASLQQQESRDPLAQDVIGAHYSLCLDFFFQPARLIFHKPLLHTICSSKTELTNLERTACCWGFDGKTRKVSFCHKHLRKQCGGSFPIFWGSWKELMVHQVIISPTKNYRAVQFHQS